MRYLLFAAMLAGCNNPGTKFKVGDCIQSNWPLERWETREPPKKILEIGQDEYRTTGWNEPFKWEDFSDVVACPEGRPFKTMESVCAKHPWFKCDPTPDLAEKNHSGLYIHLHGLTIEQYDRVLSAAEEP